jgi:hypothetical protein
MIIKEPFNVYLAQGRFLSPSAYKNCNTPSEVWDKQKDPPSQDNPVFVFGHALHTDRLEAKLFDSSVIIDRNEDYPVQDYNEVSGTISMRPKQNRNHRARLQMKAFMEGKELLTKEQYDLLKKMVTAFPKYNPELVDLLDPEGAIIETSFYGKAIFSDKGIFEGFGDIPDLDYQPADTELLVKTRPDFLKPGRFYLDIKSIESGLPKLMAKDGINYGYDIQAAFIMDFCNFLLKQNEDTFFFLTFEKKKPYQSVLFLAPKRMIVTGRVKYQARLERLHKHEDNGYRVYATHPGDLFVEIPWPGYATLDEDSVINW